MKSRILGLLTVGLLAGPMTANASLVGDTVTGDLRIDTFLQNWFSAANGGTGDTAVVGAGVEFSTSLVAYFPVQADFSADTLTLTQLNAFGNGSASGYTVQLGDLDFGAGLTISAVSLLSNQFSTLTYSFTGNSIFIDIDA
jgi:hypothetical protein